MNDNENLNNIGAVSPAPNTSNMKFDPMTGKPIINKKKFNYNRKILFVLGILALVGAGIFAFFKFTGGNSVSSDLSSIFDPNKPIVVKKDNKYIYISSEGKEMFNKSFYLAKDFYGEFAVVQTDNPDGSGKVYQVIDKKGNVKLQETGYTAPTYYDEYNIWIANNKLYNSSFKSVLPDNVSVYYKENGYLTFVDYSNSRSGVIDCTGKTIFSWNKSSIDFNISSNSSNPNDLYASLRHNSRQVIISLKNGKVLYELTDPENYRISYNSDGVFYIYNSDYKKEKWLYFANGKLAYEGASDIYDLDVEDYEKQILRVDYGYSYEEKGKSQRYYYYDIKNNNMLDKKPDKSSSNTSVDVDTIELEYGYKKFSSSGNFGLMSGKSIIIDAKYDDIEFIDAGLFNYMKSRGKELVLLENNDTTELMDLKSKKVLATFDTTYVYDYDDSTFLKISVYEDYKATGYYYYNVISGKSIFVDANDSTSVKSNYIIVTSNGTKKYYNTNLKNIYTIE